MAANRKPVGKKREAANATVVYYDASELPLRKKHWFLPSPDGTGDAEVKRDVHHASQFCADKYGFGRVETPSCNEWLTQQIVREYAVELFGTADKSDPAYQNGKPYNLAAYTVLQRHVEKRHFVWGDVPTFNSGAWVAEMNAKTMILEMLRYQDDFMELQAQMVKAFCMENLIRVVSKHEATYDLQRRMEAEKDNSRWIKLLRQMRELRGWFKSCPHCDGELICRDDLN